MASVDLDEQDRRATASSEASSSEGYRDDEVRLHCHLTKCEVYASLDFNGENILAVTMPIELPG